MNEYMTCKLIPYAAMEERFLPEYRLSKITNSDGDSNEFQ